MISAQNTMVIKYESSENYMLCNSMLEEWCLTVSKLNEYSLEINMELSIIIGAVGNILFGLKSLPQVAHCYKSKSTTGLSLGMIICDFGGNIACTYYIYHTVGFKIWWQFVNYGLATLFLIILLIMMLTYKHKD